MNKNNILRAVLPIAGLFVIFIIFNIFTNWRMVSNLPLVLSQAYVVMISATGVFFIMTMGGLDFSQGSILGISSIAVCITEKYSHLL